METTIRWTKQGVSLMREYYPIVNCFKAKESHLQHSYLAKNRKEMWKFTPRKTVVRDKERRFIPQQSSLLSKLSMKNTNEIVSLREYTHDPLYYGVERDTLNVKTNVRKSTPIPSSPTLQYQNKRERRLKRITRKYVPVRCNKSTKPTLQPKKSNKKSTEKDILYRPPYRISRMVFYPRLLPLRHRRIPMFFGELLRWDTVILRTVREKDTRYKSLIIIPKNVTKHSDFTSIDKYKTENSDTPTPFRYSSNVQCIDMKELTNTRLDTGQNNRKRQPSCKQPIIGSAKSRRNNLQIKGYSRKQHNRSSRSSPRCLSKERSYLQQSTLPASLPSTQDTKITRTSVHTRQQTEFHKEAQVQKQEDSGRNYKTKESSLTEEISNTYNEKYGVSPQENDITQWTTEESEGLDHVLNLKTEKRLLKVTPTSQEDVDEMVQYNNVSVTDKTPASQELQETADFQETTHNQENDLPLHQYASGLNESTQSPNTVQQMQVGTVTPMMPRRCLVENKESSFQNGPPPKCNYHLQASKSDLNKLTGGKENVTLKMPDGTKLKVVKYVAPPITKNYTKSTHTDCSLKSVETLIAQPTQEVSKDYDQSKMHATNEEHVKYSTLIPAEPRNKENESQDMKAKYTFSIKSKTNTQTNNGKDSTWISKEDKKRNKDYRFRYLSSWNEVNEERRWNSDIRKKNLW